MTKGKTSAKEKSAENGTAVTASNASTNLPATINMEADAGMGSENITEQDLAIPFIKCLTDTSPEVKKTHPKYVQGAEAGMIFNTVTKELHDGEEGILVVPVAFKRQELEWRPDNGGLAGVHEPEEGLMATTTRDENKNYVLPNGNVLVDTHQHYIMVLNPETRSYYPAICGMTISRIKPSKEWNSNILTVQKPKSDGSGTFNPARFGQIWRMKTFLDSNSKGAWINWTVNFEKFVEDAKLYEDAKARHNSVKAGTTKVDHEANADSAPKVASAAVDDPF